MGRLASRLEARPLGCPRKQFEKYERHEAYEAQTDYLEFAGRPHLMMVGEGWQEIAEAIDGWLDGALEAPAALAPGASV